VAHHRGLLGQLPDHLGGVVGDLSEGLLDEDFASEPFTDESLEYVFVARR
jgi:hypothetical protein